MSEQDQRNPHDVSEAIRKAAHDETAPRAPRAEREDRGGRGGRDRDRDRDDDDDGGGRGGRRMGGGFGRKKVCRFCTDSDYVMDYKNVRLLQSFTSEHGKIVPRRISGNCAFHQRTLTTSLKRARQLALVGYTSPGL